MRKYKGGVIAIAVSLLFGCLTFFSCKKNGPTVGVITVLDTVGRPVSAATVTVWQDTSHNTQTGLQSTLRQINNTDVSGKASFEFQQEAYLNITATKSTFKDSATGIIQLKEHETVNVTVHF